MTLILFRLLAVISLPLSGQSAESLSWYKATASMEPTIQSGALMGVDKAAYRRAADVRRGDIIVFRFPEAPDQLFVKRVIALPRERISMKDGRVAISNVPLTVRGRGGSRTEIAGKEQYRTEGAGTCGEIADNLPALRLGEEQFFVLGDNRCKSRDSRFWGPLAFSLVVGKVVEIR